MIVQKKQRGEKLPEFCDTQQKNSQDWELLSDAHKTTENRELPNDHKTTQNRELPNDSKTTQVKKSPKIEWP